jgi:hypothetical protein
MFRGYARVCGAATRTCTQGAACTVLTAATLLGGQAGAGAAVTPRAVRALAFDDQHNGNGSYNRSSSPFNSPNINRGIQQITTANSGGRNIIQASFCGKKHRCKMVQRAYASGW